MVNAVDYAIQMLEDESQTIEGVLVNHGTYVGKLLKTDSRVPARLKGDRHVDFFREVFMADEGTGGISSIHCLLRQEWFSTTRVVSARKIFSGL